MRYSLQAWVGYSLVNSRKTVPQVFTSSSVNSIRGMGSPLKKVTINFRWPCIPAVSGHYSISVHFTPTSYCVIVLCDVVLSQGYLLLWERNAFPSILMVPISTFPINNSLPWKFLTHNKILEHMIKN